MAVPSSNSQGALLASGVIARAKRKGVRIKLVSSRGRELVFALPDGRAVTIFSANINYKLKEHHMGLHRFGITPKIGKFDFAIFSLSDNSTSTAYIFHTSEIKGIWSLTLRFDHLNRKSKYDFARERWQILQPKS